MFAASQGRLCPCIVKLRRQVEIAAFAGAARPAAEGPQAQHFRVNTTFDLQVPRVRARGLVVERADVAAVELLAHRQQRASEAFSRKASGLGTWRHRKRTFSSSCMRRSAARRRLATLPADHQQSTPEEHRSGHVLPCAQRVGCRARCASVLGRSDRSAVGAVIRPPSAKSLPATSSHTRQSADRKSDGRAVATVGASPSLPTRADVILSSDR